MTDFAVDFVPDFCALCDRPILKDQSYRWDGSVLAHTICCNEDNRNND